MIADGWRGEGALLFGGSGFLGRYVVREMARAGWRVRVTGQDTQRGTFAHRQ